MEVIYKMEINPNTMTLREMAENMRKLHEQGYETFLEGIGNGAVRIIIK